MSEMFDYENLYYTDEKAVTDTNLKTFDELDFVVFSNQEWTRLHESHSKDIKVNWPDGHYTMGIEKHIADLKAMFVYAPDTNIKVHPVKFGSGEFTSVIGVMTGTFTKPMPPVVSTWTVTPQPGEPMATVPTKTSTPRTLTPQPSQ